MFHFENSFNIVIDNYYFNMRVYILFQVESFRFLKNNKINI